MSGPGPAASAYRLLLRLYPRRFRDEYGADMVGLFSEQLNDEATARVCARAAVDFALTIPTCHLEARMNRPPTRLLSTVFGSVAVASLLVAVVTGSNLGMLVLTVPIAIVAAGLAVLDRRRNAPVAAPSADRWWKLLATGGGLLVGMVVITTSTGEVSSVAWPFVMAAFLTSFLLLAAGAVLGVAHFAGRHTPA